MSDHYPEPSSPEAPVNLAGEIVNEDAMADQPVRASGAMLPEEAGLTQAEYEEFRLFARQLCAELDHSPHVIEQRRLARLGQLAIDDLEDLRRRLQSR